MTTDVLARVRIMQPPLIARAGELRDYLGPHLVALTCGSMFASAIVLPSFATDALGVKGLYEITLGVFTSSTLSFGWIHRVEVKENGPLGLVLSLPTALIALFALRPSAKNLASYLPLSAAIAIMIIVHVVPRARNSFLTLNSHALGNFFRADHVSQRSGSDDASVGSSSIRSRGFPLGVLNQYTRSNLEPRDLEHIGYRGDYNMAAINARWDALSISDTESGLNSGSSTTTLDESTNRL
ncbi:uncharacterized protein RCO7_06000 [Rhynchosporium graminicola]|uniref:Uncharacterized protein n=1 Tax=Rhynchosporium graminicola TaxID=2792576 RepID=A0A1E1KXF0_9HELO|nr:uncharacterized protein RCO7_06000 [Rhynchosporium commune]